MATRSTDDAPAPGTPYQSYLDRDAHPPTPGVREHVWQPPEGEAEIPIERYVSREFFELEKHRLWPKVWQMACREEHLPEPGDYTLYEICDHSFILARQDDGSIRAFYNACLHRGRMLRTEPGSTRQFRCPFHGLTWGLDGRMQELPCAWDFPGVDPAALPLPQARVARWGGWVFLNMDEAAPPLEHYLRPLPEHFATWGLAQSYLGVHVAKVIRANWKAVLDAFSEAWHSQDTHPQILPFTGDTNTRYDIWPDNPHVDRMITPFGVPSPLLEGQIGEGDILAAMAALGEGGRRPAGMAAIELPEGVTGRQVAAGKARETAEAMWGCPLPEAPESELLDGILYNVFPNFVPWGGYGPNINYRFRPHGNDHEACVMEVMLLLRHPADQPKPPPAELRWLEADEPWSTATELGGLGAIFDQDNSNLPWVQRGMKATARSRLLLAHVQESRIRHYHGTLMRYLNGA
ncbi:MAG: aromatic ring-hydroxylating dioxygenase subunit alpha [Gammaproteobacteria bacterium]|nr:aromatic ring-hydroxylating dioxygenase subunit alpha [Gammaproteobacteria bacterium]TVQ48596.1 MAG: aromatic ring-hydroxylating dioxygenase subunit alpha [Gammaproteobacteria bacterium]